MDDKTREFLENLIKAFDEIAGRITYFISYSDGVSNAAQAASDSKKEDEMKQYKGVKVKQRLDGRWYGRITLMPGIYYDVYGVTQEECFQKVKKFMNSPKLLKDKQRGAAERQRKRQEEKMMNASTCCTLREWHEYWMRNFKQPNLKGSSIRFLSNLWKNHIAKLADEKMDMLTPAKLQEFLSSVPKDAVRRKVYVTLGDMFRKALAMDVIHKNPMEAVMPPRYKAKERAAMEPEEQRLFLQAAKDAEYYPLYALMLFEGLRTGEAKALRHCDIKEDCIIVRAAVNDLGEIDTTKTGCVRRVPIFAAFKPIADKLRSPSTELIFGPPSKHTGNDEYREIMKALGMDYNMYTLRHTFATNCARAGVVTKQVSLWMGHTDVSMTLRYYTNISESFEAANVKAIDTNSTQILPK